MFVFLQEVEKARMREDGEFGKIRMYVGISRLNSHEKLQIEQ